MLRHSYRLAAKFRLIPALYIDCLGHRAKTQGQKRSANPDPEQTSENAHFFPMVPRTFTFSLQILSNWRTLQVCALQDVEMAQTQLQLKMQNIMVGLFS